MSEGSQPNKNDGDARAPLTAPTRRSNLGLWLGGLGILLLIIALHWNSYDAPISRDEGEYLYAAKLLRQGLPPYENSFLQKPPMIIYTYALAEVIAPNTLWFPRILAVLFCTLATGLLGYIARREFGAGYALPAMWLMTLMIMLPGIGQAGANTEVFMLLPLLGTLAVYARGRHTGGGAGYWLAAGFLGAVTLLYKYTALPMVLFVFTSWSVEEWRRERNFRNLCRYWLGGALGGALAAAAVLGYFLMKDGGKHWWECTVVFNRFYAQSSSFGSSGLRFRLEELLSNWWILFLLLGVLVWRPAPRRLFWLGMFAAGWLGTGASLLGHYYVPLMPIWALLATLAIHQLATLATQKFSWPPDYARRGFLALVLLLLFLPDATWVFRSKQNYAEGKLAIWKSFLEAGEVAAHAKALTSPQDYVYVAGSEPQILVEAQRLSPTRFVIAYPLMIPTPLARGYQQEAIQDLQARPPGVIVVARSPTSWMNEAGSPPEFRAYLSQLLKDDYDQVGGYLYDQRGGHWQEPLAANEMGNCSYLIFKRKPR